MLKIYLDWNCITHSKDKYLQILNIVEAYGDRIIFPFSNAHIRDILVSHKEGNKYFNHDLEILERICNKHYLLFEEGQMQPKFATPKEVLNICGNSLELIQNLEFISPKTYASIKDEIKKLMPPSIFQKVQGAKPNEVISVIDRYISSVMSYQDLESLLISFQTELKQLVNAETRFKTICMALDMFGYRPEKKSKNLMNIDTDASHLFYAGHCDLFVTADSKLRGKAEALYSRYGYQTRILSPEQLDVFIGDEIQKEYSLTYILEVIDKYGSPKIESDGAHYTLLPNHILGTFNVCHKMDKFWGYEGEINAALFRYCFNNTPYLFFTEIEHFCDFVLNLLPPSKKNEFNENFVKPLLSRDYKTTVTAQYTFNCLDLDISINILTDPITPVPAPMMLIIYGDNFEELYKQYSSPQR